MKLSKKYKPRNSKMKPTLRFERERPNITIPKGFYLIQDTREQRPLFKNEGKLKGKILDKGLKTGDYSIKGMETIVTVERKNVSDLFGSLGVHRERFDREITRMKKMQWVGLMIEGTEDKVIRKQEFSQMSPRSIYGSLCSMEVDGIHVYYARCKRDAQDWILTRLIKFFNRVREGKIEGETRKT